MKKIAIFVSLMISSQNLFAETNNSQIPVKYKYLSAQQFNNGVSWSKQPYVRFRDSELRGQDRKMMVRISADTSGKITSAVIEQSSGLGSLDQKILNAIKNAKFRPYKENGVALPFTVSQPFNLLSDQYQVTKSNQVEPEFCTLSFDSKNWNAQYLKQETKFQYQVQPQSFTIKTASIGSSKKVIDFSFQLSRKNTLSDITLLKSSGVAEIDHQVLSSLINAQITAPRKFWQLGKLKFQDQIVFWKSDCY